VTEAGVPGAGTDAVSGGGERTTDGYVASGMHENVLMHACGECTW